MLKRTLILQGARVNVNANFWRIMIFHVVLDGVFAIVGSLRRPGLLKYCRLRLIALHQRYGGPGVIQVNIWIRCTQRPPLDRTGSGDKRLDTLQKISCQVINKLAEVSSILCSSFSGRFAQIVPQGLSFANVNLHLVRISCKVSSVEFRPLVDALIIRKVVVWLG